MEDCDFRTGTHYPTYIHMDIHQVSYKTTHYVWTRNANCRLFKYQFALHTQFLAENYHDTNLNYK